MTDKRLSDNEIIKALECCFDSCNANCPLYDYKDCKQRLHLSSLTLIKRQKAEIRETRRDLLNEIFILEHQVETVRAEAIKEVFEKLEERLFVHSFKAASEDYTRGQVDCMEFVDSRIEELKKEMVGDDK